ncbi:hypothetical protein NDA14_000936 [Ustilago hordei]|uniref:uncharacterized protein n=1 Tax=Ustilago hordei TaxID=120017 RepID=UPI001A3724AD|nr:uncharacterized protein UHO2_03617 [Ustilago hordei]KAJ1578940.1 hypothetical protein NDA15_002738 [Ustilago hordei]KAJ1580796.1 hypothetical protein NDA12_006731 [Ustilago hordei]KAJ1597214.1 hypothetical protein NDA14_000936 [Ustilago hordei]SYW75223.1 uncharacterized protein UHO2_03617 [Ustilago hordei]
MSEPLLGVILATSSSRGSHIVFRWPNNPKLFKRYSKVKYYTDARPPGRSHLDDDLDPVRQKAKWDRHDEDEDDNADANPPDNGQSDTPSSSDVEDSDGTVADDDENRSVRDPAETIVSYGRSKGGAAPSTSRSKSKARRPMTGLEESTQSVRSADRQNGGHRDNGDTHDKAPDSDAGTSKEFSPEEKARREERAARAYKTYLGYDIEILASILNPRPELAHQKFELIVDDLAFLGHPVSAGKAGTWGDPENNRDGNDKDADDDNDRSKAQTQQRGRSGLRKEVRPYDLQDGEETSKDSTAPTSAKNDKAELQSSAKSRSISQSCMELTTDSTTSSKSHAPLSSFHLVLVLDRPDPSAAMSGMDLSSWLQLFYDNIVFKMTAALFAEQSKSDYVGCETEKLLSLRERCMDDGQAYAAYAAQCLGISSLARCIRDLHKSISTSSDAFLTINDRIEVHLQLPPILQDPTNLPKTVDIETELDPNDPIFLSGGGFAGLGKEGADEDGGGGTYDRLLDLAPHQLSFEEWCRTTGPYLLPWKTLLLLHDQADETLARGRQTPGNSSPAGMASPGGGGSTGPEAHGFEQLARNFTSLFRLNLNHSLNLSEVADMLGWNLYEDVYPMVRHLIYYRQARVIDIPRVHHVYAISPLFDFARLGPLSTIWAQTFPDMVPLPVFLSQLSSSARPLSTYFPSRHQRELALDVLIWLLRREVVVKMHIRLRLIATENVKRRTAERRIERHERHRARKEKKRERAARAEARRIKKSQAEEKQKRKAAEQAEREKAEAGVKEVGQQENRGRSRDGDRSRSTDARRQATATAEATEGEGMKDDCDICATSEEAAVPTSGLSVSRPPILAHPDRVAEAAAAAAEIAGGSTGAEERKSTSREHDGHHHHHHHGHHHHLHHHHLHHHRHHHRHPKDSTGGTDSSAAAATDATTAEKSPVPINIGPSKQAFDELKFERRPVLRSRSPSTAMKTPASMSQGLSVSFSNLSERGELGHRARADTTGSTSSGGAGLGLAQGRNRGDGLSMTPTTSQQSRPTTPNVIGRSIPLHVRDRSAGGGSSNVSSSAEGSVPGRARRATSSASRGGGRKGVARSRSPSRARMRVKGFGVGAEVEIDEEKSDEEAAVPEEEDANADGDDRFEAKPSVLASKLRSLQLGCKEQTAGQKNSKEMKKRRISTASERPDLPPPSESEVSGAEHPSACSCDRCSTSSSSSRSISTSDFSLSSELDSDCYSPGPSRHRHRRHSTSCSGSSPTSSSPALHQSNTTTTAGEEDFTESLIVEPSRASRRENEYISTMVAEKEPATVKNFFRLLPYLNGKHTIDEIEYRVRMRRRDIRRLLNVFREFIVTFMHP